ncbi:conserved hypothetical protein [Gluconacetobacter diazotrophicus PA1 5]|uniref:Uncharacterized protein n=1 Tax=Gluconacetobacter diazotrophicus TaxID=33996 RepID=A0A7W4I761_GLUDI|nr:hypothetical protein [Gluconacetobacter diazotrophicus]ACI52931.1 conserved hypothetical protein [Gluconacetobacter diazotrophicus PA1 5]MBB2157524.1 hypothetical protein [Gluconacetobacter diazotrophicus]TWB08924.1 hypothetical protein FBZ86_10524 [Gluconacetobacter diazotrophicus]
MAGGGTGTQGNGTAKQAYEARRAAKAGVSLDRWMDQKDERRTVAKAAPARSNPPPANPLLALARSTWRRLMDRAHRPL